MRASSISIQRFCHASSAVEPSADADRHVAVEALGDGDPDRLDPQQAPVDAAHMVLAIVERRAPAGAFEITAFRRLQYFTVLTRPWRRTQDAQSPRASV